jgi:hypothetical protein
MHIIILHIQIRNGDKTKSPNNTSAYFDSRQKYKNHPTILVHVSYRDRLETETIKKNLHLVLVLAVVVL